MLSLLLQLLPFLLIFASYIYFKYCFWSSRNVPGPRAVFPFGYHFQKAFADPLALELQWSQQYGPAYGVYTGLTPTLSITDPQLIKQVLVKDFPLFIDRRELNSSHQIWNLNLFNADGPSWKRIRSITSPTFSTAKLRSMIPLMDRCVSKLVQYLDGVIANGTSEVLVKELFTGFTIDVIATTNFATDVLCPYSSTTTGDRDRQQQLCPLLSHSLTFFRLNAIRVAAIFALPKWLLRLLGIQTIFPDDSLSFFVSLSQKIIQNRRQSDTKAPKRNDLLQLLMDAYVYDGQLKNLVDYEKLAVDLEKDPELHIESSTHQHHNSKKQTLSESEITAQVILFFVAGFETTAATLTHAIFQLVRNPQIQHRLFLELSAICEQCNNATNTTEYYDQVLNQAPYLEAVLKETLRMYPPIIRIERRLAAESYNLCGIALEKDCLIEIPTVAVHYNAQYYPSPHQFNPERFLGEPTFPKHAFLPFGQGPRNCIGMRFAFQELKLCLAQLVVRYCFEATAGTPEQLTFLKGSIMLNSKAFPVKISKR